LQSKKQEILVRILFLYNKVKSNILLLHLKNSSFLEKLFFAIIIKTKITKNKAICKILIANLLKNNKNTIIKKIINIYKYKNYKYINKSKKKYYLNNNKYYKLN